ncbi:type I glyceraldehyde-3-phosphate dehydrogenase [Candidatus Dojkabacteria bacterium]|uniref:Type I glyceraldehyde-3-phosphate dehydrogenase n=1 Tax=Candidatus Dojkabacteria bacterium TaxID=2099670 RepID=A0A955L8Z4_9BACT|nr:type I glyceraldehyde-3-phosphate dehydrogenase [Candidatus Dojkabacteria bacterium]
MSRLRVGINGFGRIGRAFTRIAALRDECDVVMINTRKTDPEMLRYLLQYDSVYRTFEKEITFDDAHIYIDGKQIIASKEADPSRIDWNAHGVDVVVDATGAFKTKEELSQHLGGSVKKVVLTAPEKDDQIPTVVLGASESIPDGEVISNASCTTNCGAPLFKTLHDAFGIESGFLTTAHAYTSTQPLLDDAGKDFTRSRAAGLSLVPTSSGASEAVAKVIPELHGKIDAMALRVPLPAGSFVDISANISQDTTADEVNDLFKSKAENELKGILKYETDSIVSTDIIGLPYSTIFDANYTKVIAGRLVKIFAWYDNEWGYSTRLVDLVTKLGV